jgi:hypothetical protein
MGKQNKNKKRGIPGAWADFTSISAILPLGPQLLNHLAAQLPTAQLHAMTDTVDP